MYIGNGAYCYANSASMLVKTIGEDISPGLIEVLTGVGLGVTMYKNGGFFLHNNTGAPDVGLSHALKILGFSFREEISGEEQACPLEALRVTLEKSTALLGPLDMGYLNYSPNHQYAKGADHFVLAYKMEGDYIYVHDPAGYPYVRLTLEQLQLAWQATDIPYGRGAYNYWHSIERVAQPTEREVYNQAISYFQHLYRETDEIGARMGAKSGLEAVGAFSEKLLGNDIPQSVANELKYFVFQLGAKRANDYANYFEQHQPRLAQLKRSQAEILGLCHSLAVQEDWKSLSSVIQEFGEVEAAFENEMLTLVI